MADVVLVMGGGDKSWSAGVSEALEMTLGTKNPGVGRTSVAGFEGEGNGAGGGGGAVGTSGMGVEEDFSGAMGV